MYCRLWLASLVALLTGCATPGRDWPTWGGDSSRNMVSTEPCAPLLIGDSDLIDEHPRLAWSAKLGRAVYGSPVVAGDKVLVATDNRGLRQAERDGDRGVLLCFNLHTGALLWQFAVPKIDVAGDFVGDIPGIGMCTTPTVVDDRVYILSNRCRVICLDLEGMSNGNDGIQDEARHYDRPREHRIDLDDRGEVVTTIDPRPSPDRRIYATDADILWSHDLITSCGVWPQDTPSSAILILGDRLYVGTGNATDRAERGVPRPFAPSLVCLDRHSGQLIAGDRAKLAIRTWHGQWSSPSLCQLGDRQLVIYGGGDGWCYAFDAEPAAAADGGLAILPTIWRCDANPRSYRDKPYNRGLVGTAKRRAPKTAGIGPSEVIATPVVVDGLVYVCIGQDPVHGTGAGCLTCIDPGGSGVITDTHVRWRQTALGRSLSTPAVSDSTVFAVDLSGRVMALNRADGSVAWEHELGQRVWSSPLLIHDGLLVTTEQGALVMLDPADGDVIDSLQLGTACHSSPVLAQGHLFVACRGRLFAWRSTP